MKRFFALMLCAILTLSLTACAAQKRKNIGSGTPGVVAPIDWSGYDELLEKSRFETDEGQRSLYMHQAEEMLMDTGAIIPLTHSSTYYICKPDIKGIFYPPQDHLNFSRIYREGDDGSTPLAIHIGSEPKNLDVVSNTAADVSTIGKNVSAGLMGFSPEGELIPDLAESVEVSEDKTEYRFLMREGLQWSNGDKLDAEDFVYSWQRATSTANAFEFREMLNIIDGYPDHLNISAEDGGRIFRVKLSAPTGYFLGLCAHPGIYPVYRKQVESAKGYQNADGKVVNPSAWASEGNLITCGPYTIGEWKHNESITLKKNPLYYQADQIRTETVIMMLNGDMAANYAAYASDAICMNEGGVPSDILPTLLDSPEYHPVQNLNSGYIIFNVKDELFAGMTAEEAATFRKALGLTIDRNFLTKVVLSTSPQIANAFVPPYISDGTGNEFGENPDYRYPVDGGYFPKEADVDAAREMLQSIGFEFNKDGKLKDPIAVDYMFNSLASNEAVATAIQADWAQLGINTTLSQREWAVFLGERSNKNFTSVRGSWNADYDDAYNFLSLFASTSPNNDAALGQ